MQFSKTNIFDIPVDHIKGVGEDTAMYLKKMGLHNLKQVLLHLPYRYEDRTTLCRIQDIRVDDTVTIQGIVMNVDTNFTRKPARTTVKVSDGTSSITVCFFSQVAKIKNELKKGREVRFFGKCKRGNHGLEIVNPEFIFPREDGGWLWDKGYFPIYTSTQGFYHGRLRRVINSALNELIADQTEQPLDHESKISLKSALLEVHNPGTQYPIERWNSFSTKYQNRLIVDELVAQQVGGLYRKRTSHSLKSRGLTSDVDIQKKFTDTLNFQLTGAQDRVLRDISRDLAQNTPMHRLLHGDVGSGKTLVAAASAWRVVHHGFQVVVMAPTEILAEQLTQNFRKFLAPLGVTVELLPKGNSKKKKELLSSIASGNCGVVIGTHALLQDGVEFADVGLIIIDEQHRFGVEQRLQLRHKASSKEYAPHQLVMSATPIPRTLTMTAFCDLEVSVLDELPPGRTPVKTLILPTEERDKLASRVLSVIRDKKEQVYWVCPLVDESEKNDYAAAETMVMLLHDLLPGARIGMVHGRLSSKEKQKEMELFSNHEIDVLVATTVIEVGVDVPNASLMVIEDAQKLGLAQLHQLRGRVGRGTAESYCIMLYDKSSISEVGRVRLATLREHSDGFVIAQADLELRGTGDILGVKQSGSIHYAIADLSRDKNLVPLASEIATRLVEQYPSKAECLTRFWFDGDSHFIHA